VLIRHCFEGDYTLEGSSEEAVQLDRCKRGQKRKRKSPLSVALGEISSRSFRISSLSYFCFFRVVISNCLISNIRAEIAQPSNTAGGSPDFEGRENLSLQYSPLSRSASKRLLFLLAHFNSLFLFFFLSPSWILKTLLDQLLLVALIAVPPPFDHSETSLLPT